MSNGLAPHVAGVVADYKDGDDGNGDADVANHPADAVLANLLSYLCCSGASAGTGYATMSTFSHLTPTKQL